MNELVLLADRRDLPDPVIRIETGNHDKTDVEAAAVRPENGHGIIPEQGIRVGIETGVDGQRGGKQRGQCKRE